MSRRKRREEFAAEMAARVATQDAPVPGLGQSAAANGWSPVDAPDLHADDADGCICRVALGIHATQDTDKTRRERFSQLFLDHSQLGPTYSPYEQLRLVHCYGGGADGQRFVVGTAFYDIRFFQGPAGYGGPAPPPEELGAAFCAVQLPTPWPWVQLIPVIKGWLSRSPHGLGYPDLDARYTAYCPNPDNARRLVSEEMASMVAGRDDWGLTINRRVLACVTRDPLSSGTDAEQLVAATTRMAALLPAGPQLPH
jgi:hypothetical protein